MSLFIIIFVNGKKFGKKAISKKKKIDEIIK